MNKLLKSKIKYRLFIVLFGLTPTALSAQQNTVKFNLLPLVSKTFSFEYERTIKPQISVNANIAFRGKSSVPFKDKIEDLIDDEEVLKDAALSHFTFTPI